MRNASNQITKPAHRGADAILICVKMLLPTIMIYFFTLEVVINTSQNGKVVMVSIKCPHKPNLMSNDNTIAILQR